MVGAAHAFLAGAGVVLGENVDIQRYRPLIITGLPSMMTLIILCLLKCLDYQRIFIVTYHRQQSRWLEFLNCSKRLKTGNHLFHVIHFFHINSYAK
jgi:hypothetical protein